MHFMIQATNEYTSLGDYVTRTRLQAFDMGTCPDVKIVLSHGKLV